MIIVVEGWFIRKGVDGIARHECWSAFFGHETAFDLFDDIVSCHRMDDVERLDEETGVVDVCMNGYYVERKDRSRTHVLRFISIPDGRWNNTSG